METIYEVVRIKQVVREMEVDRLTSPDDVAKLAQRLIGDEDREVFLVICLNTKAQAIAIHRVHVGTIDASLVHPREVLKTAILNNATSIIVAHNHPSGSLIPSMEDISVTERLESACEIIGIPLLDHVIVSVNKDNYLSFKEKGYLA